MLVNGYARAYFSAPTTPPHLIEQATPLLATARQGWAQEKSPLRQVFLAQLMGAAVAGRPDKPRLSRRQTQILGLVAQGMTDKQIARGPGRKGCRATHFRACAPRHEVWASRQLNCHR